MLAIVAFAQNASAPTPERSFGGDVEFMRKHTDVVVLTDGDAQIAVCPKYQGRVMTSTARGAGAPGYGWINDELIASGKPTPHICVWGGEDRFWMGPEGGQYAIFFKKGDPFDLDHWQTPAAIDSDAYAIIAEKERQVEFEHQTSLVNCSGAALEVKIHRAVRLLTRDRIARELGSAPPVGVSVVAYESWNRITNTGSTAWTKETGLLSIWILGMFKPSPAAVVVAPFNAGDERERGPIVNDAYFGKVPADRLHVNRDFLLFRGDGQLRSKIGISPKRAKPVVGSYDVQRGVLTIVQFTLPEGASEYVNSMWELQKEPYAGDAVNSYNDGPSKPGGKPFGPFYELETSSPALALAPGASAEHTHRTMHFEGPRAALNEIAKRVLGVELDRVEAFAGARETRDR
ncbi:MAG: DUF6786 family protein [Phycisphaerae bacterium]